MLVWLEGWEWDCCGTPFAVGSVVEWGLVPVGPERRAVLAEVLGAELVAGLTHRETHHEDEPTVRTQGRVESIRVVRCALAFPGPGPQCRSVPGSAVAEAVDAVGLDRVVWDFDDDPGDDDSEVSVEAGRPAWETSGYLVELASLDPEG